MPLSRRKSVGMITGVLGGSRTRNRRLLKPPSLPRLEYEHGEPPPGADPGRPCTKAEPQPCAAAWLPGLDSNQRGGVQSPAGDAYPHPETVRKRDSTAQTARSELARSPDCHHSRVRRPGIEPGISRLRVECFTDIARGACNAVGVGHDRSSPYHLSGSPNARRRGPPL